MIHVAPCSCELHVRIRELEAELVGWPKPLHELMDALKRMKARAEKAEAALKNCEDRWTDWRENFSPREREAD